MSNQQLYLAIGLPSLLALANLVIVVVGFLLQSLQLEKRFDAITGRMDQQDKQVDSRFNQVGSRFTQIDSRFDQLDKRMDRQDSRFDRLEPKLDCMDTTLHEIHLMLGRHDARLDALEKERR